MHNVFYIDLYFVNYIKSISPSAARRQHFQLLQWIISLIITLTLLEVCVLEQTDHSSWTLNRSFIAFVIAGTHQHNYNHVALGSPTRTPKNGKEN